MRAYGDEVLTIGAVAALLLGIMVAMRIAVVALQAYGVLS